ncbi:methylenetetrahydrofolate reductase (NADPH) [Streptomyces sp. B3I7]|uniref:methylenetetrahydrofolate reductase n=1 Tax=Streptomyces sp. B3I7 TaxID=3042269 RepID=UPI002787F05C|nr:methylenetetrahydrofolate reductase [Streptomyces sp. B3I7]MDQ0808510.1 methylenetetrahydrofolate reductase (NADPH) [Streptomyces sp. B3I7]
MSSQSSLRDAVRSLAAGAAIEVIPLKGADDKIRVVSPDTTITITCSPKFGLQRTLNHSAQAVRAGYRVVPHLAARQVPGHAELRDFVSRLADLGITDLFVVGGDASEPAGSYSEAAQLLEALAGMDHGLTSIGVTCYPEGHPKIDDESLLAALCQKQPLAHYMVSQLCFDADALSRWLDGVRAEGIDLPLHIGLAAPMNVRKLAQLSLRIGVGASARYLSKQHGMAGAMLRGTAYRPQELLLAMGDTLTDPQMRVEALHMFSFNQVDATVAWQQYVSGATAARA